MNTVPRTKCRSCALDQHIPISGANNSAAVHPSSPSHIWSWYWLLIESLSPIKVNNPARTPARHGAFLIPPLASDTSCSARRRNAGKTRVLLAFKRHVTKSLILIGEKVLLMSCTCWRGRVFTCCSSNTSPTSTSLEHSRKAGISRCKYLFISHRNGVSWQRLWCACNHTSMETNYLPNIYLYCSNRNVYVKLFYLFAINRYWKLKYKKICILWVCGFVRCIFSPQVSESHSSRRVGFGYEWWEIHLTWKNHTECISRILYTSRHVNHDKCITHGWRSWNHVRWIYLETVLYMGNSRKYVRINKCYIAYN